MNGWIVETLIASTLLMGFVLMVRGWVAAEFGPRIAYLLWLLPAARMVLPPLPAEAVATPMASLPAMIDFEALAAMPAAAAPVESGIAWGSLLLALWLGGAALHFGWHLLAYRRFVRLTIAGSRQLPQLDRDGIEVCASAAVRGPFAAGIFVKTIVLPLDYRRRYDADELRLAMQHEAEHHRRCDMSANLVALGLLSLHWFNPIAHRAHRAYRIDQELACDAIVLAKASAAERHAYGSALLKSTCDRLPVAACALGAGDDLKRRLRMMGYKRPSRTQARIGVALAAVLTGGGLLLTASGGIAAETSRQVEETVRTQMIERADVAPSVAATAPVAPLPPLPPAPAVAPAPAPAPVVAWGDPEDAAEAAREAAEARREADQDRRDADQDRRDAEREIVEAMREARADMREAQAEARAAAHEAAAEARVALRVAHQTSIPRTVRRVCDDKTQPVMSRNEGGRELLVICTNFEPIDQAEIREIRINALESARESLAEMDGHTLPADRRAEALTQIDRQIAQLRSGRD